jgi:hypothetical protein
MLWLFMWSIVALLKKVYVFVFKVINAAFECRHAIVSSTASRRGTLRHSCGIL